MWCRLKTRFAQPSIDRLLNRAAPMLRTHDKKEIDSSGKQFFGKDTSGSANLDLLHDLHRQIWPEVQESVGFRQPVIDHCYLLIKNPRGAATQLHQDRPYWIGKEPVATIISVWIALDAITETNGGLRLSRANEVDVFAMSSFNNGAVYEHVQVAESDGSFPLLIAEPVASNLAHTMEPVEMVKGEAIAFDSFEPHMSSSNSSPAPRRAMKIAYGEDQGNQHHLIGVDELESQ